MATAKKKSEQKNVGEQPAFEDALSELEAVTRRLESDSLSLDEALSAFEEGIKLMRACDARLQGAKGKLAELVKGENGELVTQILGEDIETLQG